MASPQTQSIKRELQVAGINRTPQKVFVYGTLKKGFPNHHHYLRDCKELGVAWVEGIMFHLGHYPAINISEQFCRIMGEVYEVTWDHITAMDRLEGVGNDFYDRVQLRVDPHGIVWTYIFPHNKAAKQEYVVPSGIWEGPNTPQVKWGGFGAGVEVGSFSLDVKNDEIRIGAGTSPFILKRSPMDNLYRLINKTNGEILGPYRNMNDIISGARTRRTTLGLPKVNMKDLVDQAIRETLNEDGTVTGAYDPAPRQTRIPLANVPVVVLPGGVSRQTTLQYEPEEEEEVPQSVRLLNLKYGAA